ncbi:hypothetical protein VNI00_003834 [Paramarasmius palmivorus]|uniref:Macrophage migration inhibitory factor n=1 Tax=Paramarasmius palmivorus TaxID=297713 RepID=A0AAW0DQ71_9AGAR
MPKITDDLALAMKLSKASGSLLGPLGTQEKYIQVVVEPRKCIVFGGTAEGTYTCTIISVKAGPAEYNQSLVALFTRLMEEELGIPGERGSIFLLNPGINNIGFCGKTADALISHIGLENYLSDGEGSTEAREKGI